MPSLYLHIPFCKQACSYCDFHFSTLLKNKTHFIQAIQKEIVLQKHYFSSLPDKTIRSIYFGGGTPSLLLQEEINALLNQLHLHFSIAADAEITLEANPDDLSKQKLEALNSSGINRLSIGIQSFANDDLMLMNRAHTAEMAHRCVKEAQDAGFENISIDLIYGIPSLSEKQWLQNMNTAFALDVQHISAYCLTVEPKTALEHAIRTGKSKALNEEQAARHFEMLLEAMKKNDFIQYEISNFCRDGHYSRHNSNYWLKEAYLGLGPSAHSYNGIDRQYNIANNNSYAHALLEENKVPFTMEELSASQRYNEYILTSLRTMWGADLKKVFNDFGKEVVDHCLKEAEKYIHSSHILQHKNNLSLSQSGKLIADRIASDLFIV